MKRDIKAKLMPSKRLAVSATRATSAQHRRVASAPRLSSRSDAPPMRASNPDGPPYHFNMAPRRGTAEDRIRALEDQRGRDNAALVKAQERFAALQQICDENTKIMMEMRREFYGTKNIVEEHLVNVANRSPPPRRPSNSTWPSSPRIKPRPRK